MAEIGYADNSDQPLVRQIRAAVRAMWPHRWAWIIAAVSEMAGVAAEGLALISLASLFEILLDSGDIVSDDGVVLGFPRAALDAAGMDVTVGAIFVLVFVLIAFRAILRMAAAGAANRATTGYYKRQYDEMTDAYLRSDWRFLVGRRSGDVLNIVLSEVPKSTQLLSASLAITMGAMSALIYIVLALLISPVAVGLFVAAFAVLLLVLWPVLRLIRRWSADIIPLQGRVAQRLHEILGGTKVIKSLGVEERVHRGIRTNSARVRSLQFRSGVLKEITGGLELGILVSLAVLFVLVQGGLAQLGEAGVIAVILFRLSQRAQVVVGYVGQVAAGLPSAGAVTGMLSDLKRHTSARGLERVPEFESLRFEDVGFAYEPGIDVLAGLDLEVRRGEFLGVVGESGTGKTTLVDLMLGLLRPTSGRITISETDLQTIDPTLWRKRIGYVSQEPFLFNDTVRSNITAFRDGITDSDVVWAAGLAQAHEFILRLSQGYDHRTGDRGATISGGERQRLALARALVTMPDILLLDEATSSLDSHAEREFQEALEAVRGQFTIIAVAHRLSTVVRADRVIVLDHGRLVESGPPADLLERDDGVFRRLYQLQTGRPEENKEKSSVGSGGSGEAPAAGNSVGGAS